MQLNVVRCFWFINYRYNKILANIPEGSSNQENIELSRVILKFSPKKWKSFQVLSINLIESSLKFRLDNPVIDQLNWYLTIYTIQTEYCIQNDLEIYICSLNHHLHIQSYRKLKFLNTMSPILYHSLYWELPVLSTSSIFITLI